jgi:hypothetical protein
MRADGSAQPRRLFMSDQILDDHSVLLARFDCDQAAAAAEKAAELPPLLPVEGSRSPNCPLFGWFHSMHGCFVSQPRLWSCALRATASH